MSQSTDLGKDTIISKRTITSIILNPGTVILNLAAQLNWVIWEEGPRLNKQLESHKTNLKHTAKKTMVLLGEKLCQGPDLNLTKHLEMSKKKKPGEVSTKQLSRIMGHVSKMMVFQACRNFPNMTIRENNNKYLNIYVNWIFGYFSLFLLCNNTLSLWSTASWSTQKQGKWIRFKDLYNIMISVREQPTFLSTQLVISITWIPKLDV